MYNTKHILVFTILCLLCINSFLGVSSSSDLIKVDNISGSKYSAYNPNTDSNRIFVCFVGNDKWDGQNPVWNGTSGPKKTIKNAIATIKFNGTIYIAEGTYHENMLIISKDVTLKGINTVIDGDNKNRILKINNGHVNIHGITFTHGNRRTKSYEGGAIYNDGFLNIYDCKFTGNKAKTHGGAIYNYRVLNINNSQFINNTANCNGGAIYLTDFGLSINNTDFEDNKAADDGGSIYMYQGVLNTNNCSFYDNKAAYGGAIFVYYNSISNFKKCIFKGNNASYDGGAIKNGLGPWTPTLNIWHSQFTENIANHGAAIHNNGYLNAKANYWGSNPIKNNIIVNDYLFLGSCHISYWEIENKRNN
jgi:predicted outer membrane repeat protein